MILPMSLLKETLIDHIEYIKSCDVIRVKELFKSMSYTNLCNPRSLDFKCEN